MTDETKNRVRVYSYTNDPSGRSGLASRLKHWTISTFPLLAMLAIVIAVVQLL